MYLQVAHITSESETIIKSGHYLFHQIHQEDHEKTEEVANHHSFKGGEDGVL